jgi:PAS domain S-box-containing protein
VVPAGAPGMRGAGEGRRARAVLAVAAALAAVSAAAALLALAGHLGGVPELEQVVPHHPSQPPLAALAWLLSGCAFAAWRLRSQMPAPAGGLPLFAQRLAGGAAVAVAVIGSWGEPAMAALGVGLPAALALARPHPRRRLAFDTGLLALGTLALVFLLEPFYGHHGHAVPVLGAMPLPHAMSALALAAAALLAEPGEGLLAFLVRDGGGAQAGRRILPLVVAVPLGLGWLTSGQVAAGALAPSLATAFLAGLFCAAALAGLAGITAGMDRVEREREAAKQRVQSTLDAAADAIVTLGPDGRIAMANRAMEAIFERNREQLVGRSLGELLAPRHQEALAADLAQWRPGGGSRFVGQTVGMEALRRDGSPFPVEVSLAAWQADGQPRFTAILRDASRRKMVEDALRAARQEAESAARAKAEFLATMSHEIRTPMNAVIGMSGLLLESPLDEAQRDMAETIRASGEHLLTLLNDILDYSKLEAGKVELESVPVDVRRCVQECVAQVRLRAAEKGLPVAWEVGPEVPAAVAGDPARLRQVLLNLLNNAVKFTEEGRVEVQVSARPEPPGIELRFEVRDTGIGIPPERFDRLFQRFSQVDAGTTRAYGGTGLGLAISKRLVEAMGGRIGVASEPGKGSAFHFTVPTRPAAAAEPAAVPAPAALPPMRILVADDNPVNQKVVVRMLERLGQRPDVVANGEEAVAAALRSDYDLVLMDIQMPVMDGMEATRRIRAARGPLPRIVALSADALPGDRDRFLAAGMDDAVAKPVRLETLAAALRAARGGA